MAAVFSSHTSGSTRLAPRAENALKAASMRARPTPRRRARGWTARSFTTANVQKCAVPMTSVPSTATKTRAGSTPLSLRWARYDWRKIGVPPPPSRKPAARAPWAASTSFLSGLGPSAAGIMPCGHSVASVMPDRSCRILSTWFRPIRSGPCALHEKARWRKRPPKA